MMRYSTLLTVDRVEDLTVRATSSTLLDFGIVDLEELIEPGQQICS